MKNFITSRITRNFIRINSFIYFLFTIGFVIPSAAQEVNNKNIFYSSSLHFTANGMSYWYSKEQGGLETITGIPYEQTGCVKCHVKSCDDCHKTMENSKPVYSTEIARSQETCLRCHAGESSMIMKMDKSAIPEDVHFAAGMACMDCHTVREIHGDGKIYNSMKDYKAMDISCIHCHQGISEIESHIVHGGKLDCKACHVRHVLSGTNCNVETMIKDGKMVASPISGWKFLMNFEGQVTSANMQTFVAPGKKTMLIFAPQFSHSVQLEADKCEDCHGNKNITEIKNGTINLTWLENGVIQQAKGVIPVVDSVTYNLVFEDYKNGEWTPITDAEKPKIQYAGYGTPLTKEQLEKLAESIE